MARLPDSMKQVGGNRIQVDARKVSRGLTIQLLLKRDAAFRLRGRVARLLTAIACCVAGSKYELAIKE